ncbi:MAG: hypothetical protein ACLPYZ_05200 [Limisphaerales bacterium]
MVKVVSGDRVSFQAGRNGQATLDFNHQVFAEDKAIVEKQFPEDLPINLQEEVHIRADKSSITYRQGLARLGLGRSFTA